MSLQTTRTGGYALVNGLKMYYQTEGVGKTLVLLHGGLTTIETSFGQIIPYLKKGRRILAVEQQGHGRTGDIERELSYEQMADDTAELLKQLRITRADILGFSDGGNVALGIAIRYPQLVRKLVVVGTNYNNDGYYPEILKARKGAIAENVPKELRDAYIKIAPAPLNWSRLVVKVSRLGMTFAGWAPGHIRSIEARTMIMLGDTDFVRPEHAVEMFRLLRQSQLAVLPGTGHLLLVDQPEWAASMLSAFLQTTRAARR